MNYSHDYHAGNFADVFKHLVLLSTLENLLANHKACAYLETHAGKGCYDLLGEAAQKTREFQSGITKIMSTTDNLNIPSLIMNYQKLVKNCGYPHYYPGSPWLAHQLLKDSDRLILSELNKTVLTDLKQLFKHSQNVSTHHQNGYTSLNSLLPPKERRGLILIDPPFESTDEWQQILESIQIGIKKFATGIFMIWYPIKDLRIVENFWKKIYLLNLPKLLRVEFSVYPQDAELGLSGCGLCIVNTPWKLKENLQGALDWVWNVLSFPGAAPLKIHAR
jgi:23S rRNA (adenine2030-N6)-methyltransferase